MTLLAPFSEGGLASSTLESNLHICQPGRVHEVPVPGVHLSRYTSRDLQTVYIQGYTGQEAYQGGIYLSPRVPGRLEWAHLPPFLGSWEARMGTFPTILKVLGG